MSDDEYEEAEPSRLQELSLYLNFKAVTLIGGRNGYTSVVQVPEAIWPQFVEQLPDLIHWPAGAFYTTSRSMTGEYLSVTIVVPDAVNNDAIDHIIWPLDDAIDTLFEEEYEVPERLGDPGE